MARSADDRKFGWKAPGITRVLLASDPQEVLKALLNIGIDPRTPSALGEVVELILLQNKLVSAVYTGVQALDLAFRTYEDITAGKVGDRHTEEHEDRLRRNSKIFRNKVLASAAELKKIRDDFRRSMDAVDLKYPKLISPATPGVFEEA
jgi:hypothetical protein